MYYVDENGSVVDALQERNEEIKERLGGVLQEFLAEKEQMLKIKKPVKLGYQFTKQLYVVLASYPRMKADKFCSINYDTLNDYWVKYLELTAYYNRYFEIVDNKQTFMAFCGINSRQYSELERHNDEDIRNLMLEINAAFVGLGFLASESGNADVKATSARLGAKEVGHSVVAADTEVLAQAVIQRSPTEMWKEVEGIVGKKLLK